MQLNTGRRDYDHSIRMSFSRMAGSYPTATLRCAQLSPVRSASQGAAHSIWAASFPNKPAGLFGT